MAIDVTASPLLSIDAAELSEEMLAAYVSAAVALLHPCLGTARLDGERARVANHAVALQVNRMIRAYGSGELEAVSIGRGSRSWTFRSTKSGGAVTVDPVAAGMLEHLGLGCSGYNDSRSVRGPSS